MKYFALLCTAIFALQACQQKKQADLIVYGAKIYTVDSTFSTAEALAISDGKFIAIGSKNEILQSYEAETMVDYEGQFIYPGLLDAHCHFYGLGTTVQQVNLVGTQSFEEVLERLQAFQEENPFPSLTGRGWDHEDWPEKKFPTFKEINALFPDIPLLIQRIDGHAALANQKALDLANITVDSKIDGGTFEVIDGKLTGILIDNAVDSVFRAAIPKPSKSYQIQSLLDAEKITLPYGLTSLSDAGLDYDVIDLIDSLQQAGELKTRLYTMVSANPENLARIRSEGKRKTDRLQVNSVKFYLDGALGSRGACLLHPYADKKNWSGFLLNDENTFREWAKELAELKWQLNTHCIGDSANRIALKVYEKFTQGTNLRWRIEHAQVVNGLDFSAFKNPHILPSVQPTHATSDMYWAEDRLGKERINGAYAYKQLLEANGSLALGTDFPVEKVSPFLTFYAAVSRQDLDQYPDGGFLPQEALTREEALKGMTIWAAYANQQEEEVGSIAIGKKADFMVLDLDLMSSPLLDIAKTESAEAVYIAGEKVY